MTYNSDECQINNEERKIMTKKKGQEKKSE